MTYTLDTTAASRRLEAAGIDAKAVQTIIEKVIEAEERFCPPPDLGPLQAQLMSQIAAAQEFTAKNLIAALRSFG